MNSQVSNAFVALKGNEKSNIVKPLTDHAGTKDKTDGNIPSNETVVVVLSLHPSNETVEKFKNIFISSHNSSDVLTSTSTPQNYTNVTHKRKYFNKPTKKDDEINIPQKSKGHIKNQIRRRKRSLLSPNHRDSITTKKELPLIVDYITTHEPKHREELLLPITKTQNTIQNSNLADFNIETIHTDNQPLNQKQTIKEFNDIKTIQPSIDSVQNYNNGEHRRQISENVLPNLNAITSNFKEPEKKDHENSEENQPKVNLKNNAKIHDLQDIQDNSKSKESYESAEIQNSMEEKSTEREDDENEYYNKHPSSKDFSDDTFNNTSTEQSQEVNEEITRDSNESQSHKTKKYENQTAEEDEEVSIESNEQDHNKLPNASESNEYYKNSNSQEERIETQNAQQTHINDEEVKPVVEIYKESDEISEEISNNNSYRKDNNRIVLAGDDKSVSEENISTRDDKLEKVDVKQQFERIPLNYNHAKKQSKTKIKTKNVEKTEIPASETETFKQEKNNEGSFSPIDHTYDDNLNIKFHDLTIKLPEIKLPDDILSFDYGKPIYYKEEKTDKEKKKDYFDYEDENSNEKKSEKEIAQEDDSYKYHSKEDEYNNEDKNNKVTMNEQDKEDLYDKFVRERFGKKPLKQSENLQNYEHGNPILHNKIKNILKKTANIHKQAEKSGDPNANYMWTLEYGEKL